MIQEDKGSMYVLVVESMSSDLKVGRWSGFINWWILFSFSSFILPFYLFSFLSFPVCEVRSGVQNKRKGICGLSGVKKVVKEEKWGFSWEKVRLANCWESSAFFPVLSVHYSHRFLANALPLISRSYIFLGLPS